MADDNGKPPSKPTTGGQHDHDPKTGAFHQPPLSEGPKTQRAVPTNDVPNTDGGPKKTGDSKE